MIIEPKYNELCIELDKELSGLPGKIIAIDGADGSGKTTLGRYLAYHYNVSLVETDLFFYGTGSQKYYYDHLKRIIDFRCSIPRPVIIEGVAILDLLSKLERQKDYLIYVINEKFSGNDYLKETLENYRKLYLPRENADYLLSLSHSFS